MTLRQVVEAELQAAYERGLKDGATAEREECAELAAWLLKMPTNDISAAIRAREQS